MPRNPDIKKVLMIGSGPIVIGQAAEFDYAGTQACRSLKEEGIEVVLLNSNPATIMTDKDIADKVYIEPLTVEVVEQLILKVPAVDMGFDGLVVKSCLNKFAANLIQALVNELLTVVVRRFKVAVSAIVKKQACLASDVLSDPFSNISHN